MTKDESTPAEACPAKSPTPSKERGSGEPRRGAQAVARSGRIVSDLAAAAAAGALLGLFLARFWYELDPVVFSALGEWPGTIGLALAASAFLAAQWWFLRSQHSPWRMRHLLGPDAALCIHLPFALLLVYVFWPEVDLRLAAFLLLASTGLALALAVTGSLDAPRPLTVHRLAPLVLMLIVFATYGLTLDTHVGEADTFEFQVVAPALGIAHPTGYPLYVMLGKLFSLLPFGSMAFRVNLTSAVTGTLAAVVVYALVARLGGRRLVAFVAALAFASAHVMWSQSIVAEVYALNALIAGLTLALLIDLLSDRAGARFAPAPDGINRGPAPPIYMVGPLFLLMGLGISHHLTAILLLPAAALAILIARPRLPIRASLLALALLLLGVCVWLYIPLRWPALHGGAPMTFEQFVEYITGARFGGALALDAWRDSARWSIVGRQLLEAYGPVGIALVVAGIAGLIAAEWPVALATGMAFAAYVFYGVVYVVPDVAVFLIPAYLILAVWLGVGASALVTLAIQRIAWRMPSLQRLVYPAVLSLLVLMPVFLLASNMSRVNQRGAGAPAEAWGRYVLDLPIPEGAAILADSEKIAPLYYLQANENVRPDLDILVLGTEEEYRRQLDARLAPARSVPVYLARFLPNLPYRMRSLGPLVEVSNAIETQPPPAAHRDGAVFGDMIELAAASVAGSAEPVSGGPSAEIILRSPRPPKGGVGGEAEELRANLARVTLYWRALTDTRPNYHVRLRLVDDGGRVWWEDIGAHPVSGYYPTGAWQKGEVVADYHEVELDATVPPGEYVLQAGLFPPFGDKGLEAGGGDAWRTVGHLIAGTARSAPSLGRALRQVFGGKIAVSGVTPPGIVPKSSDGQVRLSWARIGEIGDREIRASLALVDAAGDVVWSDMFEPYHGAFPVVEWPSGNLQTALGFRAPQQDGAYGLRLAFLDETGAPLPARCGWLAPTANGCLIGSVQVEGEAIGGAINFDNQALLTDWSVDRAEMRPGERIEVRLTWRGLKEWEDDYTVTVQLIGPDGRLHGQVDAWPVQGTLPTSAWQAGQTVTDAYLVTLQPDAPGGRYRVEVGWYLLGTLRRLPVVNANGRPVEDRFVIGEFAVP